ncbi:hypothetical protein CA85_47170 [Allorhodopirellula solitaria]|uniref:Transposase IS116/IS110/IS902 family protein n=2 Tax=Allorhodopirellula solitaria TaxID=2527987 RepID=A0A5C5X176_9BACT|nr:hypothetical protein CA85_47170 [Allorhodopirellula solitaria]
MPGYADLFEDDKLFTKSIAIAVAKHFPSSASIKRASSKSIAKYLKSQKIRYQSDEVDRSSSVAKICNRRLRAACMMVATNLIKCHPYDRGQAALMKIKKVATVGEEKGDGGSFS